MSNQPKSAVDEILELLEVGRGGPVRLVGGTSTEKKVMLQEITVDAEAKNVTATVNIKGWKQDGQGRTSKVDRTFILQPEEAQRLSREAGDQRLAFSVAASTMKQQLAKEQAQRKAAFDSWCDKGAPTEAPTKAMKPIKFKAAGS